MMKNRNYFKKVIGLWMSLSFSMKHFSFGVINKGCYMNSFLEKPELWFNDAALMLSYKGKQSEDKPDFLLLSPELYSLGGEGNEIFTINAPCLTDNKMVYVPIGQEKEKKVLICFLSFIGIKKALEELSLGERIFSFPNDSENHKMMNLLGKFVRKCNWALVNYSYSSFLAREISKGKPVIFRIVIYDEDPKHRFNSINVVHNEEYKKLNLSEDEVEKVVYKDLDQAFRPNDSGINGSLFNSEMREMYKINVDTNIKSRSFCQNTKTNDIITKVMNKEKFDNYLQPIFKTFLDTRYSNNSKFYNVLPVEHIYEELIEMVDHNTSLVTRMIEEGSYTVSLDMIAETANIVEEYMNYLKNFKDAKGINFKKSDMHLTLSNNGINTTTKEELGELNINLKKQDRTITDNLVKLFPVLSQSFKSLLEKLDELKKIKQKDEFNQAFNIKSLIENFQGILIKYEGKWGIEKIDMMLEEIQGTLTNAQSQVLEFKNNKSYSQTQTQLPQNQFIQQRRYY